MVTPSGEPRLANLYHSWCLTAQSRPTINTGHNSQAIEKKNGFRAPLSFRSCLGVAKQGSMFSVQPHHLRLPNLPDPPALDLL